MSVSFNNNEYESEGMKPFVNEWCSATITNVSDDQNSKGNGYFVCFEYTVTDGANKGRSFKQWYNYEHSNEEAERIAREHLCAIGRMVNIKDIVLPERVNDFLNKKLRIKISQKKDDDFPNVKEYGEPLTSTGFSDLEDTANIAGGAPEPARSARDPYAV